jgi:two-component system chemotaxis response regulator CheB
VQDPAEAMYPSMPTNAINYMQPDYIQPITDLVDTLVRLTATTNGRRGKEQAMDDPAPQPHLEDAQEGKVAPFSCPDCGGTLWETEGGDAISYRCRVGHAFTMSTLLARHGEVVERSLWAAYRALEERSAMSRRVARRLEERGRLESGERFTRQADGSARQAAELKAVLDQLEAAPDAGAKLDPVTADRG